MTAVGTVREARECLHGGEWDAFLFDISLPDGCGLEADATRLASSGRKRALCSFSGHDRNEDVGTRPTRWARPSLAKPFRPSDVLSFL